MIRSAGFPILPYRRFLMGRRREVVRAAGLEARDNADLEIGVAAEPRPMMKTQRGFS